MSKRSLKSPPLEEQPFPVRGYILINGFLYIFCLLIYWSAWFVLRGETMGLGAVLGGLAVCFTLVSVYDAVFDRMVLRRRVREDQIEEKSNLVEKSKTSGKSIAEMPSKPSTGVSGLPSS